MFENSVHIMGHSQFQLAVGVVAAQSQYILLPGVFDMWADVDVWVKNHKTDATTGLTTLTGYKIIAGNVVPVHITQASVLGAIALATGTLNVHKVSN